LRSQPDRLPVRMKLLEIFARRQDRTAFRDAALRVQAITAAQGPEWATVVSWGKALDPNDALYTDEAEASSSLPLEPDDLPTDDTRNAFAAPSSAQPISAFDNLDVDLDLDLDKNTSTFQDNRDTSPMPIDGFGINTAAQSVDVNFGAMDGSAPAGAQADNNQAAQDPLRTKLSLAREFLSIGDVTAARAMAQEVLEQGDESLQAQAKALLASLG
jgi:pilus assembly protein FimV